MIIPNLLDGYGTLNHLRSGLLVIATSHHSPSNSVDTNIQ